MEMITLRRTVLSLMMPLVALVLALPALLSPFASDHGLQVVHADNHDGDELGGGNGDELGGCTDGVFCNPLQFDSIEDLLRAILQAVILIAFPIIVLFLVLAGFKFVTAQGNPKAIEDARKLFFYTLIGALVVLGAQALSYAIQETVNELM